MTIGALAKAAGMGVENHPLLPARRLVAEPEKPYWKHPPLRRSGPLARLHFIRNAPQWAGVQVWMEIRGLLTLQGNGTHCDECRVFGRANKTSQLRGR